MMTNIALVIVALNIGVLVGAIGVGGILLPSALSFFTGEAIQQSMATSLFTFIFTGIAGTIYFHRKGSIDWKLARPVCLGSAGAGFMGAWASSYLSTATLSLILAAIIIFAGANMLKEGKAKGAEPSAFSPKHQELLLLVIGAVAGFGSGLAGIGGPVLSVPLMVLCGYPILTSIGIGQVMQIVGAISGSAANAYLGTIDFHLAGLITFFEVCGVVIGAHIIHKIDHGIVKRCVGALCLIIGMVFMYRSIIMH